MGFETHKQYKTNVVARLVLPNFYFLKASSKGLKIKLIFLNNGISKNFKSHYVYMVLALKKGFIDTMLFQRLFKFIAARLYVKL